MVTVKINGQQRNWDGDPDLPLLWFLRDEAGLTGTKYGCGQALCGACTVIVDKQAVRACITSVSDVAGREVTTIEGLHPTGDHAVQKAWRQLNVPQCGYCQAGQIMQAAALLIENPKPNHDQICCCVSLADQVRSPTMSRFRQTSGRKCGAPCGSDPPRRNLL